MRYVVDEEIRLVALSTVECADSTCCSRGAVWIGQRSFRRRDDRTTELYSETHWVTQINRWRRWSVTLTQSFSKCDLFLLLATYAAAILFRLSDEKPHEMKTQGPTAVYRDDHLMNNVKHLISIHLVLSIDRFSITVSSMVRWVARIRIHIVPRHPLFTMFQRWIITRRKAQEEVVLEVWWITKC